MSLLLYAFIVVTHTLWKMDLDHKIEINLFPRGLMIWPYHSIRNIFLVILFCHGNESGRS
jgi:hypothetical protein